MYTVEDVSRSLQTFGWTDFTVFGLMLVICMGIGVYFNHKDGKKRNDSAKPEDDAAVQLEYLVGGRKMKVFPVAVSLAASLISGISLLGTSTEIYVYGYHYVFFLLANPISAAVLHYFLLPVFLDMRLTSIYEYLERRFDRSLRVFGSFIFLFGMFLKIPIMIYIPAIAFNQVSGVDIYLTTIIVCFVCIFYTCIGGIKAVVWTDVIQGFVMFGSLIIVAVKGTIDVGGLGVVLERNLNSTRIEAPIFDLDPTLRTSIWSAFIGGCSYYVSLNGFEQSMVQRYVSLPTLKDARKAVWIFVASGMILLSFSMYNGFLIHAIYHDCDPLSTGLAKKKDQLVPLLVMEVMGRYPFLSGCFMVGVFSASLSSLSTALNSMTAVILEDYIKHSYGDKLTRRTTSLIMKSTVVIIGVTTTALVFIVEKLGPVLGLCISLAGVTYGPLLGVFIIGLAMPWIGARPTLIGAVFGIIASGWIVFQAQVDTLVGTLSYAEKPVTTEGCLYSFNTTIPEPRLESDKSFYHISYLYYSGVGTLVTLLVANLYCVVFGKQDSRTVDVELLTPPVRKFFTTEKMKLSKVYSDDTRNEFVYVPTK